MNLRSWTRKVIAVTLLLIGTLAVAVLIRVTGVHRIRHERTRVSSHGRELAVTISLPRWGSGPFPAIVVVHGSGPRRAQDQSMVWRNLVPEGMVVLTYDKPGVGESTGQFQEVRTDTSEQQLRAIAGDVLACLEVLRKHPLVDPTRVGLFGGSQAGWIIPLATDVQKDIPFSVILSGPATSYGMEMYYSSLTGEGLGPGSGLSTDEIEQRLNTYNGLVGYEPRPVLAGLQTPTLWLFGEQDISIPARRSATILRELQNQGAPFTVRVYPNGNHNLEDYATRKELSFWQDIVDWLRARQVLR